MALYLINASIMSLGPLVISLTLSCLLFGQASTSGPAFYKNTNELVGVVSRWPRGAALVFESQIQLVECDGISSIEAWSPTHLKLRTVFGQTVEIDVRKIRKAEASIWDKKPSPIKEVDINNLKGKFVGPARDAAGYVGEPGKSFAIGVGTLRGTSFSIAEEVKITSIRSEDGKIHISLPKGGLPVCVKSLDSYLAIMPGNSRFGPLKLISPAHSQTLVSDAHIYFALRFKSGL